MDLHLCMEVKCNFRNELDWTRDRHMYRYNMLEEDRSMLALYMFHSDLCSRINRYMFHYSMLVVYQGMATQCMSRSGSRWRKDRCSFQNSMQMLLVGTIRFISAAIGVILTGECKRKKKIMILTLVRQVPQCAVLESRSVHCPEQHAGLIPRQGRARQAPQ